MKLHLSTKSTPRKKSFLFTLIILLPWIFLFPTNAASPFAPATPESQGISSSSLDEIMNEIQWCFDHDFIVGSEILIIKNRRTVLHEAVGWKDREKKRAWELNTICNIRSMSKPVTGAAAQILIDDGVLGLDDAAAEFLIGFDNPNSNMISLKLLLTHRSGLPLSILTSLDDYDSLLSLANATGEMGPQFEPDSKFWYSDAGTEVVGAIVEQISGQRLDHFITKNLLQPLGMDDSFSTSPNGDDDPRWDRMASAYFGAPENWTPFWNPEGKQTFYTFPLGSQSIYSTPVDYAKFLAMWMDEGLALDGQRILTREAVKRTLTPASIMSQLGSNDPMPSGFDGLRVYYGQMSILYCPSEGDDQSTPIIIGHSGSDGTWAWAWPEQDLIVLYFTQSRGQATGIRLETILDQYIIHDGEAPYIPDEYAPYIGSYKGTSTPFRDKIFKIDVLHNKMALNISGYPFFQLKDSDSQGRWYAEAIPSVMVKFEKNANGEISVMRFYDSGQSFRFEKIQSTAVEDWILQ
ncbi:MAG: beta-lactamase family protein [Candidatus Omnitrophica bacterium]|nr:beta-lactamase family protein [Candidatus Omnitrophota bacterium]